MSVVLEFTLLVPSQQHRDCRSAAWRHSASFGLEAEFNPAGYRRLGAERKASCGRARPPRTPVAIGPLDGHASVHFRHPPAPGDQPPSPSHHLPSAPVAPPTPRCCGASGLSRGGRALGRSSNDRVPGGTTASTATSSSPSSPARLALRLAVVAEEDSSRAPAVSPLPAPPRLGFPKFGGR